MGRPRGIDLSGSKVIASVLATLTGAIAASYLRVAGTLVGAAVGSLASTMGTEVYRHYLIRSQERPKAAGVCASTGRRGRAPASRPPARSPATRAAGPAAAGAGGAG